MALSNVSLPAAAWNGRAKEGGQVLAQRAVAREHGIEDDRALPAAHRPGTRWPPRSTFRRAQRIAEGGDGLAAFGRHQRINGAEHAVQAVAGAAAQTLALIFNRIA